MKRKQLNLAECWEGNIKKKAPSSSGVQPITDESDSELKEDLINLRIKLPFLSLSIKAKNFNLCGMISILGSHCVLLKTKYSACSYCRFAQKHSLLTFYKG